MDIDLTHLALENSLDRLIETWRGDAIPGGAIGVVQGAALIAHCHAGQASLELGVPIGRGTCFRIASVSKEFTCTAVRRSRRL